MCKRVEVKLSTVLTLMEVNSFTLAPGSKTLTSIWWRSRWAPELVWAWWWRQRPQLYCKGSDVDQVWTFYLWGETLDFTAWQTHHRYKKYLWFAVDASLFPLSTKFLVKILLLCGFHSVCMCVAILFIFLAPFPF